MKEKEVLDVIRIAELVQGRLQSRKALWYLTPNPRLGNERPVDIIKNGDSARLVKYLERALGKSPEDRLRKIAEQRAKKVEFYSTGITGLDHVLGGGVVLGHTLLLAGKKGVGKTTLLLQACDGYARDGRKAYFASGEMSRDTVIEYARRLGIVNSNIELYGNPEGLCVEDVIENVLATGCTFLCLDSVDTSYLSDIKGDIGQVTMMDAVGNMVTSFALLKKRAVVLIKQYNKNGTTFVSEKFNNYLIDGELCMDPVYRGMDANGHPRDSNVRRLYVGGDTPRLRRVQSNVTQTAYIELTASGFRELSTKAFIGL